jgi:hypothetical protein
MLFNQKIISKSALLGILTINSFLGSTIAIAETQIPICYQVTSVGQVINLTAICTPNNRIDTTAIIATDLSLEVPNEDFLSAKVKSKITNRSSKSITVDSIQIQINQAQISIAVIPILINRTIKSGESISVAELFDSSDLKGYKASDLSLQFQGWQ